MTSRSPDPEARLLNQCLGLGRWLDGDEPQPFIRRTAAYRLTRLLDESTVAMLTTCLGARPMRSSI